VRGREKEARRGERGRERGERDEIGRGREGERENKE